VGIYYERFSFLGHCSQVGSLKSYDDRYSGINTYASAPISRIITLEAYLPI
jgi:hypothetical protein